jgi:hypothetical protein
VRIVVARSRPHCEIIACFEDSDIKTHYPTAEISVLFEACKRIMNTDFTTRLPLFSCAIRLPEMYRKEIGG